MNVDQMASKHAQQAMDAQNRRKRWNTKGKFGRSQNGKYTDISNYSFGQYKQMYAKMFGGKKSSSGGSSGGGGGGGSSSNRITQMLRHVANNAVGQYQRAQADKRASLANMSKNELLKLLSQTLQRQK